MLTRYFLFLIFFLLLSYLGGFEKGQMLIRLTMYRAMGKETGSGKVDDAKDDDAKVDDADRGGEESEEEDQNDTNVS